MFRKTFTRIVVLCSIITVFFQPASAQNILAGVTSNGGSGGRGTVFTMNTDGSNYSLVQSFADYGKSPYGNLVKGDDGNFYGMTYNGGTYGYGTIFKMTPSGNVSVLKQFNGTTDGSYPQGELTKGANGVFYGMTSSGSAGSYGTIFTITSDGVFTVIRNFNYAADGASPRGHLVPGSDGNYYGITYSGGANAYGTIFKLTPSGVYTVLHQMSNTSDGGYSHSSLTEGTDGNLYGTAYSGGTYGYGTIFTITKAGVFSVLKHLNTADGTYPQSELVQAADGNFYGSCYGGGSNSGGTLFKITTGGVFTVLRNLKYSTDGAYPYGALLTYTDGALYGITSSGGTTGYGTLYKLTTAGVYTVLHSLVPAAEGSLSYSAFVQGNDGNLYAMATAGGISNTGTAFKATTSGAVTLLCSFNGSGALGNDPEESLIKGKDSAYYVVNAAGGAYGYGCVVKICGGVSSLFYSFNKSITGATPKGNLLLASDGNFYGTTYEGGPNGGGTIFKLTTSGALTVLRSLSSSDGYYPTGSLIQGTDGFLYGMTGSGGANSNGTIFKISTAGAFTLLKSFIFSTDGGNPQGDLLQASDGNFYGMTTNSGTLFRLTPGGVFMVLKTFTSATGSSPYGSLMQANDGNLYGTTSDGGGNLSGVVFQMTLSGVYKVLTNMSSTTGRRPKGILIQGQDGWLYGTNSSGGTYNGGTIFKISTSGSYTVLHNLNLDNEGGNPYGSLVFAPINNLVANAQAVTTQQDKAVAIALTGSGNISLTYTLAAQPKNGTVTGTGASRTYTPNAGFFGKDSFYFSVSTGCMASAPAKVNITVTQVISVNHAPVLNPIGNKTVVKGKQLKFTATATDADAGQTLKYSLLNAPTGAKINAATGVFTWKPTQAGAYTATVRVTDNGSPVMYDEETITITVTATLTTFDKEENKKSLSATATDLFKATLYPNPVHNMCIVQLNAPAQKIMITIMDAKGTAVIRKQLQLNGSLSTSLNITELVNGAYFLLVETEKGKQGIAFIKE